jgi:hypothetical protein
MTCATPAMRRYTGITQGGAKASIEAPGNRSVRRETNRAESTASPIHDGATTRIFIQCPGLSGPLSV